MSSVRNYLYKLNENYFQKRILASEQITYLNHVAYNTEIIPQFLQANKVLNISFV